MNHMIHTILEMDRNARKQTEEAEEYKRRAQQDLREKRDVLFQKYQQQAQQEVDRLAQEEKLGMQKVIDEVRAKNRSAIDRMNAAYEANRAFWESEIARRAMETKTDCVLK